MCQIFTSIIVNLGIKLGLSYHLPPINGEARQQYTDLDLDLNLVLIQIFLS